MEGYVLNAQTGATIPAADVTMACLYLSGRKGCLSNVSTKSSAVGKFQFDSILAGSYMFLAQAKGLFRDWWGGSID